jgi:hypothetical protein
MEKDVHYAAGVIDTGSSFSILKSDGKWRSSLVIRRSQPEQLEMLSKMFGGRMKEHDSFFYLNMRGSVLTSFLKEIQPYLRVKHRHAEILLQLQEMKSTGMYGVRRGHPLPKEADDARQKLLEELRSLG